MISATCRSMLWSGLSDVIGSWKIMVTSAPRMPRNVCSSAFKRSTPFIRISPEGCDAAG